MMHRVMSALAALLIGFLVTMCAGPIHVQPTLQSVTEGDESRPVVADFGSSIGRYTYDEAGALILIAYTDKESNRLSAIDFYMGGENRLRRVEYFNGAQSKLYNFGPTGSTADSTVTVMKPSDQNSPLGTTPQSRPTNSDRSLEKLRVLHITGEAWSLTGDQSVATKLSEGDEITIEGAQLWVVTGADSYLHLGMAKDANPEELGVDLRLFPGSVIENYGFLIVDLLQLRIPSGKVILTGPINSYTENFESKNMRIASGLANTEFNSRGTMVKFEPALNHVDIYSGFIDSMVNRWQQVGFLSSADLQAPQRIVLSPDGDVNATKDQNSEIDANEGVSMVNSAPADWSELALP